MFGTHSGATTLDTILILLLQLLGQLLEERIWSIFHLKMDHYTEGFHCPWKQTRSYESYFPLKDGKNKTMEVYFLTLGLVELFNLIALRMAKTP